MCCSNEGGGGLRNREIEAIGPPGITELQRLPFVILRSGGLKWDSDPLFKGPGRQFIKTSLLRV